MSRPLSIDRLLDDWLAEGPVDLPDRVVDGIVNQVEQTRQRGLLWPPGGTRMTRTMYALGGIAAVLVLLASTGWYLGWFSGGSGIGSHPTAAPTATPTPVQLPATGQIAPGRYYTDVGLFRYTFTVASTGWQVVDGQNGLIIKGNISGTDFANLWLWGQIDPTQQVWGTACQWTGTSFTPGPTVDDMATALAGLSGFQTTQPIATSVDGYAGKFVTLTVPSDAIFAACPQLEYRSWDGRYYQAPGQSDDVRIIDLHANRTLIFTTRYAGTPQTTLTEQRDMLASLDIQNKP